MARLPESPWIFWSVDNNAQVDEAIENEAMIHRSVPYRHHSIDYVRWTLTCKRTGCHKLQKTFSRHAGQLEGNGRWQTYQVERETCCTSRQIRTALAHHCNQQWEALLDLLNPEDSTLWKLSKRLWKKKLLHQRSIARTVEFTLIKTRQRLSQIASRINVVPTTTT